MVTLMKLHLKGSAKCLIFSLAAAALAGCAVYEPYPGSYGAYDPYGYGQPGVFRRSVLCRAADFARLVVRRARWRRRHHSITADTAPAGALADGADGTARAQAGCGEMYIL